MGIAFRRLPWLAAAVSLVAVAGAASAARQRAHEAVGFQLFESPSPTPSGTPRTRPPSRWSGPTFRGDATLLVDGAPATGTLTFAAGATGLFRVNRNVTVDINQSESPGLHLLQLQNPAGPLSNELPFCVGARANCNS